jgi:hypothetical protein
MQVNPLHHATTRTAPAPGNGARTESAAPVTSGWPVSSHPLGWAAQLLVAAGMLAGLWVAISPWFLALQIPRGGNTTANDLIVGLAVAILGLATLSGLSRVEGLQAGSLLAGIWLIISPFILAAKFGVTASMYWSNIWSGAIVALTALGVLALAKSRSAS